MMKKYADGSVVRVGKIEDFTGFTYVAELDGSRWYITAHKFGLAYEEFFEGFVVEEVLAGGEIEPTWEEGSVVAREYVAYIFEGSETGWKSTSMSQTWFISTGYIDRLIASGDAEILRGGLSYE